MSLKVKIVTHPPFLFPNKLQGNNVPMKESSTFWSREKEEESDLKIPPGSHPEDNPYES